MTTFDEAWETADRITGWLTRAQGEALWTAARALPSSSTVVEIGSHQGRSTVVLARAAAATSSRVVAVDPFVDGRLFGGQATRTLFERNVTTTGVAGSVRLESCYSQDLLERWRDPVHLLYVDGKHDYWSCTRDLRWTRHMSDSDVVLVHDAFSSIGVTASLLRQTLTPASRLRYRGRTGSLAGYEVGRPTLGDRLRVGRELPWFLRNVAIKVMLRLRLRGLARWAGHDSPYDPY